MALEGSAPTPVPPVTTQSQTQKTTAANTASSSAKATEKRTQAGTDATKRTGEWDAPTQTDKAAQ